MDKKITDTNLIELNAHAKDKQDVFCHLADLLDKDGRLNDRTEYLNNVGERENLTTTGIGFGIAIPHGKTNAVKDISVAFARLENPIDWNSLDGQPVDLVFQLAVPETCKGDEHLKLISALSRNLIHDEFREQIRNSTCQEEVLDLIMQSVGQAVTV